MKRMTIKLILSTPSSTVTLTGATAASATVTQVINVTAKCISQALCDGALVTEHCNLKAACAVAHNSC